MWLRTLIQISFATTFVTAKEKQDAAHQTKNHLRAAPRPRIIGGDETEPTRFPFTVSLQNIQHFCGGSLIAPDVVLTAAVSLGAYACCRPPIAATILMFLSFTRTINQHCTIVDFKQVKVVIGSHTVDGKVTMGKEVEEIPAGRVYTHPDYNSMDNNNDFALVFLPRPAVSNVEYVRLNTDGQVPLAGDTLTAIGWGDISVESSYDPSNILMEVDVDYIENDVCDASADSKESYQGMILDGMLCASSPGKDGCQGDSGELSKWDA